MVTARGTPRFTGDKSLKQKNSPAGYPANEATNDGSGLGEWLRETTFAGIPKIKCIRRNLKLPI